MHVESFENGLGREWHWNATIKTLTKSHSYRDYSIQKAAYFNISPRKAMNETN